MIFYHVNTILFYIINHIKILDRNNQDNKVNLSICFYVNTYFYGNKYYYLD